MGLRPPLFPRGLLEDGGMTDRPDEDRKDRFRAYASICTGLAAMLEEAEKMGWAGTVDVLYEEWGRACRLREAARAEASG